MRTRNQEYAEKIFNQMHQVDKSERGKYGSLVYKLPILIRTAGLAQALAFVKARGKSAGEILLGHIAAVVGEEDLLTRSLTVKELPEYIRLTHKVLAALVWYKRFAQGLWGIDEAGADRGMVDEYETGLS